MTKKSSRQHKQGIQRTRAIVTMLAFLFAGIVIGFLATKAITRTDSGTELTKATQAEASALLLFEDQLSQYKQLVIKYNELAKSTGSIIQEHNALVPVINANNIKPEGVGAGYFAYTYTAPSCLVAVPFPGTLAPTRSSHTTQPATCE